MAARTFLAISAAASGVALSPLGSVLANTSLRRPSRLTSALIAESSQVFMLLRS